MIFQTKGPVKVERKWEYAKYAFVEVSEYWVRKSVKTKHVRK